MATLVPSNFCHYELEPTEEKRGRLFSTENLYVLQNLLATKAQEKIELAAVKASYDEYWQREAELQGAIRVLREIIDGHYSQLGELEYGSIES